MYLVTPYPNTLYALDLSRPGPAVKWKYQPVSTPFAQGVACCDVVNRGAVYDDGVVYFNTLDGQTVAVDASTGKEKWKTKVGDINRGETITMAPPRHPCNGSGFIVGGGSARLAGSEQTCARVRPGARGRIELLSELGLFSAGLFALVALAQWIPSLVNGSCW